MSRLTLTSGEHAALTASMRAIVRPIVRDSDTADDLVLEAWARLVDQYDSLGETPNVVGWLFTVARNLALNHIKSGAVRFRARVELNDVTPPTADPTPSDIAVSQSERERITAVLGELSPRYRKIIEYCDVDGLSYAEAGQAMGLSEAAITSLLYRARERFRRVYRLQLAPEWIRAAAEQENVDDLLEHINPFNPPVDLAGELDERARNHFESIAGQWDSVRKSVVPKDFEKYLLERAGLRPHMSALDAGTGTGSIAMHLAPVVRRVIGLDRSEAMLKIARKRVLSQRRRNIIMEFGDLLDMPVRNGAIDAVFCSLVLRHLLEPGKAVAGLAKTLKPGGTMVISDVVKSKRTAVPGDIRDGLKSKEVGRWMQEAGLTAVDVDEISMDGGVSKLLIASGRRPE